MLLRSISLVSSILFVSTYFAQTWQQEASAPGDGRHHPVTFALDGKGYMVAGSTDFVTGSDDFYEYDPITDSWTTLPDFPGVGRGFSISDTWNGKAYMGFGFGANNDYLKDIWEFDPTNGTWTELTSCPCEERVHPAFVIEDGMLFVGLGNNDINGNLDDWWEYNIATDSWRQLADLPGGERHHPFMFSANGDVYAGFGHGNGPGTVVYKSWYRWDIDSESWTQMNDHPTEGRVAGTQFSIGDRGFVLSGDGDDHFTMATGEFWEYDYINDSWSELPSHPGVSRWAPGSFVIDNVVYLVAGEIRSGNPNSGLQNDLWSFDLDALANAEYEDELNAISLFPNPALNMLKLDGVNSFSNLKINIINSTGQIVIQENYEYQGIDVSKLNSGIYFVTIDIEGSAVKHLKFTKE